MFHYESAPRVHYGPSPDSTVHRNQDVHLLLCYNKAFCNFTESPNLGSELLQDRQTDRQTDVR